MMFKEGDRVRILKIDPRDDTPTVKAGDVITLACDADTDGGEYLFILTSREDTGTYAKIEMVQPAPPRTEVVPDPGAEAVDAANHAADIAHVAELKQMACLEGVPGCAGHLPEPGRGENTLTSKDTNPKDAVAVAHLKFSSVPWRVMPGVALALSEGAWKYGRHNYRVAGVKASVYFDACLDHLFAWFEGEDIDPDSGRHHIDKAIAGLFVLRDCMLGGKVDDDRPPAVEPGWIAEGHEATKALFDRMREKCPTPKAPFVRER